MKSNFFIILGFFQGIITSLKFFCAITLNSVAILTSSVDSFVDVIMFFITWSSFKYAGRDADWNHRYGHGKIVGLQGVVQSLFIIGSVLGIWLVIGFKFFSHTLVPLKEEAMHYHWSFTGYNILFFVLLFEGCTLLYIAWTYWKSKKFMLYTVMIHISQDFILTCTASLVYIIGIYWSFHYLDALLSIVFSIFFLFQVYRILKKSFNILLDHELDLPIREQIQDIILSVPGVDAVHDMRTRSNGDEMFVDFHLELHGGMSLFQAHGIAEEVNTRLKKKFHAIHIVIHQEPTGICDKKFLDNS